MFAKPFAYHRAHSFEEACELLRRYGGEAKAIAGGQSLLPMINLGLIEPAAVIDISHIDEERGVTQADGVLRIGALARHRQVEQDMTVHTSQPLLAAAAHSVGNPRARARGTIGGSLSHADPAAELPLAMTALGAEYELSDGGSVRRVPASDFAVSYFTTQLREDELLAAVSVPTLGPGWGWGFQEVARRPGDFAIVAAAALVRCTGGEIVEARVALGGIADRPVRMSAVEMALAGAREEDVDARVGPNEGLDPVTDSAATAEYRRHLARVLTVRAIVQACRRVEEAA